MLAGARVKRWMLGCVLLGLALPVIAGSMKLEWRDNLLSVSAQGVPVAEILESISRETGLIIEGIPAADSLVTLDFSRLRLHAALEELQRGQPFLLIETPAEGLGAPRFVVAKASDPPVPNPEGSAENQPTGTLVDDLSAADGEARVAALDENRDLDGEGRGQEAALLAALTDTDPVLRRHASERLRARGDRRALDILVAAAATGPIEVRAMLLRDLGTIDDERVFALIAEASGDEHPEIRGTAFEILAAGGPRAIDVLTRLLLHPDPELRISALGALAAQGPDRAREAALILRNDADEGVRSRVEALVAELEHAGRGAR